MTSPSFSWKGLLQSLFETEEDALGAAASPVASARTPRWSRSGDAASFASVADLDDAALPYSPSRLDGEYNVWFARKPLGLALVPSTQLYGTWEVSSVAPPAAQSSPPPSPDALSFHDEVRERRKIARGDVLIAVNLSTRPAQLPRDAFAAFLQQSACPVVLTLRRPAVYGSFDSRALSTAMFPTSIEYKGRDSDLEKKTFFARASSAQWQRSLQHELTTKSKRARKPKPKKNGTPREPTPEADPVSSPSSSLSSPLAASPTRENRPRNRSGADLTPMGEYTHTFHELPLPLQLAPSTRLYGSVEVYDPKQLAPRVQIGDVVMAVNGDATVAKWPTDDAIDFIAGLAPPVAITLRRPAVYRKYLETYFQASHARVASSLSTATAMFPDSAEYRHGGHYRHAKKPPQSRQPPPPPPPPPPHTARGEDAKSAPASQSGKMTKQAWERISRDLEASDQFKLWQSGSARGKSPLHASNGRAAAAAAAESLATTSAFLTERHVHYLWAHLPAYLTCNDMELVFDTRRHGWNVLSFYARVQDKGPTLLVVKDTRDQIFGAFSSTSWRRSSDVYGNGRCFVFSLRPQMRVYAWSGLDDTFMYARRDAILLGGGKKGIALCLQLDELRGFSHACDTFDSPPLAPVNRDGGAFEMENMEVWCFSGLRV